MSRFIRPLVLALTVIFAAAACTPAQMAEWLEEHDREVPESEEELAAWAQFADQFWIAFIQELARQQEAAAAAAAAPPPAAAPMAAPGSLGWPWDALVQCEASGNWYINTGNGYYGGLQFVHSTWVAHGGQQYAAYAHQAAPWQQVAIGQRVAASQGWGAWPACASRLGLL